MEVLLFILLMFVLFITLSEMAITAILYIIVFIGVLISMLFKE